MSAAFDTINRKELLNILSDIVDEDGLRIVRFLLSNTVINMKMNGATQHHSFTANTGTPQGDGLSPVLFIVYLEKALRDVRLQPDHVLLPSEVAYADDVDFVTLKEHRDVDDIQTKLRPHQLNVNTDKTEYTRIERQTNRDDESWRSVKKVGSLLGDGKDVERRKTLSTIALSKLNTVWFRHDKIKLEIRIKLYKSLVKSILLYNCGTWGLTKDQEEKLDAHHRRQLRKILGIKYPTKISNAKLYEICKESPISTTIMRARWRLFGHILRRDRDIPAFKAMQFYFNKSPTDKNFRGRERTTLPTTLARDLDRMFVGDHTYCKHLKLRNAQDLEDLRNEAQDRNKWILLTKRILKAAQAEVAVVTSAEEH